MIATLIRVGVKLGFWKPLFDTGTEVPRSFHGGQGVTPWTHTGGDKRSLLLLFVQVAGLKGSCLLSKSGDQLWPASHLACS